MKEAQRQAVRDNARYLQQVRPIDPEEINAYVTGEPHPAAVRQVLREEAADLGLLEREDGTFVPVPDDRLRIAPSTVAALPADHQRRLEDVLVDAFGPDWPTGDSGERLRSRVREVKARYLSGADVTYDEVTALGYAIYHLPATYGAARTRLAELGADGHLPRHIRVLDVGAGVGGQALALCDLLPDDALVEYHAVEPSAAAEAVLEPMLAETGRNVHTRVHAEPIETHEPHDAFDLVVCANVLSELDSPAAVTADLLDALAPEGTLLAIAPADRNTAIGLREVERAVEAEADATIYAPTCRLWPGETPTSTCWSFTRESVLEVPAVQARLDGAGEGDGEFVNVDVQYAYSVLRADDQTRVDARPSADRFALMAAMSDHVTERIDLVAIKLSHDLTVSGPGGAGTGSGDGGRGTTDRRGPDRTGVGDTPGDSGGAGDRNRGGDAERRRRDDANPLFLVGDGSEAIDHFAVLTERTSLNEPLAIADYGQALVLENVLVLWNDDEGAYNLVVDGESVVEAVPQ